MVLRVVAAICFLHSQRIFEVLLRFAQHGHHLGLDSDVVVCFDARNLPEGEFSLEWQGVRLRDLFSGTDAETPDQS